MSSFGTSIAAVAGVFLAMAVAVPGWAGRLLDVLVATLAIAMVGRRIYRSRIPGGVGSESYAPFDRVTVDRPTPELPAPIRGLADSLRATADPAQARRFAIPPAAQRVVVAEAERRLHQRHDLSLHDPAAHGRIRSLVSDSTWALIGPAPSGGSLLRDPVPQAHLGHILDDLERL